MSDPSGNSIEFDYYDGSSEPELGTATVQLYITQLQLLMFTLMVV